MTDRDYIITGHSTNREGSAQCSSVWVITDARAIIGAVVVVLVTITLTSFDPSRCVEQLFLTCFLSEMARFTNRILYFKRGWESNFHNPEWLCRHPQKWFKGFKRPATSSMHVVLSKSPCDMHNLARRSFKAPFLFYRLFMVWLQSYWGRSAVGVHEFPVGPKIVDIVTSRLPLRSRNHPSICPKYRLYYHHGDHSVYINNFDINTIEHRDMCVV